MLFQTAVRFNLLKIFLNNQLSFGNTLVISNVIKCPVFPNHQYKTQTFSVYSNIRQEM